MNTERINRHGKFISIQFPKFVAVIEKKNSMKSQIITAAVVGITLFSACKEVGPAVNLTPTEKKDTTYLTTTIPNAELRRVLVEEATGVKCVNCPEGAKILAQLSKDNPGRVIIVGLHAGALTSPIFNESKYDFRTTFAADLFNFMGGEPNKPAAGIDRQLVGASYFLDKSLWPSKIPERLAVTTPLNLSMTSSYDSTTKIATISIKGIYTSAVTAQQSLTVALIENDIEDAQEDKDTPGNGVIENYIHEHVLRDMVTPVYGTALLDELPTKEAGRVFERVIKYTLPANSTAWKINDLVLVCFVHNAGTAGKGVVQAATVSLK